MPRTKPISKPKLEVKDLLPKDSQQFATMIRYYENKQFKRAMKLNDDLLKKFPHHGEIVSMRGLIVSNLGDKNHEALEYAKKGIKLNIKSYTCWHILGIIYRQNKSYNDASKCFQHALSLEPTSIQILRDLSTLQIHQRQYESFSSTRQTILKLRPNIRMHWMVYALSRHLVRDYDTAIKVLTFIGKNYKDTYVSPYEISEICLYNTSIYEEAGLYEDALQYLNQIERNIIDKVSLLQMKGRILISSKRIDEAHNIYKDLLIKVPGDEDVAMICFATHHALAKIFEIGDLHKWSEGEKCILINESILLTGGRRKNWLKNIEWKFQNELNRKHNQVFKRRRMLTENEQDSIINVYFEMRDSSFNTKILSHTVIQFLSGDRLMNFLNVHVINEMLVHMTVSASAFMNCLYYNEEIIRILKLTLDGWVQYFDENLQLKYKDESVIIIWILLSQYQEHKKNYAAAINYIEKAITRCPDILELIYSKSRLLYKMGDFLAAYRCCDEARCRDIGDRWLNTQCAKIGLRLGKIEEVMKITESFAFQSELESKQDMQSYRYELALGDAYKQRGWMHHALRRYLKVENCFKELYSDQFDFHQYCLRRASYRAYIDFIRMHDILYSHKFYRKAVKKAVKIYHVLLDRNKGMEYAESIVKDEHVEIEAKHELNERDIAIRLNRYASMDIQTPALLYDIYIRKDKIYMVLQSLVRMWHFAGQRKYDKYLSPRLCDFLFFLVFKRTNFKGDKHKGKNGIIVDTKDKETDINYDFSSREEKYIMRVIDMIIGYSLPEINESAIEMKLRKYLDEVISIASNDRRLIITAIECIERAGESLDHYLNFKDIVIKDVEAISYKNAMKLLKSLKRKRVSQSILKSLENRIKEVHPNGFLP